MQAIKLSNKKHVWIWVCNHADTDCRRLIKVKPCWTRLTNWEDGQVLLVRESRWCRCSSIAALCMLYINCISNEFQSIVTLLVIVVKKKKHFEAVALSLHKLRIPYLCRQKTWALVHLTAVEVEIQQLDTLYSEERFLLFLLSFLCLFSSAGIVCTSSSRSFMKLF